MFEKFRLIAGGAVLSLSLTACGAADTGFHPPQIGTQISWKYKNSDGVSDDVYTVVATGPDFAILSNKTDGDETFSAEYSGIGYSGCDSSFDELPSRAERIELFSAWPPEPGTQFDFNNTDITILKTSGFEVKQLDEPVIWYEEPTTDDLKEEGWNQNSRFATSVKYGTLLEIVWGNGDHDWAVSVEQPKTETFEIQEGYETIAGLDVTKLGICSRLLTEAAPITAKETSE